MTAEKKIKYIKIAQIVLLVIACILLQSGAVTSFLAGLERGYERAAKQFEIEITKKSNDSMGSYTTYFDFGFKITNNSKKEALRVQGTMKVMDKDGNLLTYGTAKFSGEFEPDKEMLFTLSWSMDTDETALKIWETDFDDLTISFEIEEVTFEDYTTVEVDCKPYVKESVA